MAKSCGQGREQEVPAEARSRGPRCSSRRALRGLERELGRYHLPGEGLDTCLIRPLLALIFWIPSICITQGAFPVRMAPREADLGHMVSCL